MILLDVYLQWDDSSDGAEERLDLFEAATSIGQAAYASDHQLYLLTEVPFDDAVRRLKGARSGDDFLKVQEVSGRFMLTGAYPDAVHELIENAGAQGAVALDWSSRPDPAARALQERPQGVWLH